MAAQKILIVDDEAPIRQMIKLALELEGLVCLEAASAAQAHTLVVDERPDLVLLDWMMPETSGLELLRRLKRSETTQAIPVIMLTAKTEEQSAVNGLDAGAEDFIRKPFKPRELVSRIKAILRRYAPAAGSGTIDFAGLEVDLAAHRVLAGRQPVTLTPVEFKLLAFFVQNPNKAYSREQLLDRVWGGNVYVDERTVDAQIRRLRKSLQSACAEPDYSQFVQTVRGTGYRFSSGSPG